MDWREIPSLPALRAFEVAARHGSYSAAATELNVTHAAIAQHVRALERDFGTALMRRQGRGMALTAEGARLARDLSEAFGAIGAAVTSLRRSRGDAPLAVTTTYSLAESWLMPRLPGFWAAHPQVTLSITPSNAVVDLRRDGCDLAIRYGGGDWRGLDSEPLVKSDNVVVASPALAGDRATERIADLADLPWLFETQYPEGSAWAAREGLPLEHVTIRALENLNLILSAVRAGGGVAVIGRAVAQEDLRAGRLILLYHCAAEDAPGYHIVTHRGVQHPQAGVFIRWLRQQARPEI